MLTLDEIFPTEAAANRYVRALDSLWYHGLVEANECIKSAKVILCEPIEFLLDPGAGPTLGWIANVLLERAALRLINALTDDSGGSLTLRSLQDQLHSTCRPTVRPALQAMVAEATSNAALGDLEQRAKRHRHTWLAHLARASFEKPEVWTRSRVTLHELEQMLEKACAFMDALSPHAGRGYDLRRRSSTDNAAAIVEALMRTSTLLNMPERQGHQVFEAFARDFTQSQQRAFADWRARLQLPEVSLPPVP